MRHQYRQICRAFCNRPKTALFSLCVLAIYIPNADILERRLWPAKDIRADMRILAILGVKNEGAFLIEWLAHHLTVGFTDFLVFSNDCQDGTDLMLDRLQQMGHLTHVRNAVIADKGPQWSMLQAADQHPARHRADWIMVLDIDEFVNIHLGKRHLSDLITALPDATAIALTWRLFGNSDQIALQDTPVSETFTRAAPVTLGWPWRAQMFKTLFKNDETYRKLGVHRPKGQGKGTPIWYDGSGRVLPSAFHTNRIFSDYTRNNYQWAQLNHYPLGSVENYLVKADRGRANRDSSGFDMGYWVERNLNEAKDDSILGLDSQQLRKDLHSDPILGPLHQTAFLWRKSRFASLMQQEPWRALYGRILMTPPSRSLDLDQARGITAFVAKPEC